MTAKQQKLFELRMRMVGFAIFLAAVPPAARHFGGAFLCAGHMGRLGGFYFVDMAAWELGCSLTNAGSMQGAIVEGHAVFHFWATATPVC